MSYIHESVAVFLDTITNGLEELLVRVEPVHPPVAWTPRPAEFTHSNFLWWLSELSVDPACRFFAGAPGQTWEAIGRSGDPQQDRFAPLAQLLQHAAAGRFGQQVLCTGKRWPDEPPEDWTAVTVELGVAVPAMEFVLSPELVVALGGAPETSGAAALRPGEEDESSSSIGLASMNPNSVAMLMDVEIPVSVSLGRRQMRMKDLLALSRGSIVELDQELGDEVEIRANNRVIARGEVVAVDGNYGVRILKMVAKDHQKGAQSALLSGGREQAGNHT